MNINATDLCRCTHRAACHTSGVFIENIIAAPIEKVWDKTASFGCTGFKIFSGACECKKFQLNNLQYLEYKYEQRSQR